jgi:hypothetical protein
MGDIDMMKMTRRAAIAGAVLASTGLTRVAFAADPIKVWHHGGRGDGERGKYEALIAAS